MRIKFSRLSFESECMYDCINNKGFLITEPPFADVDKSIRNLGGPRSARYGTTYGDSSEFLERWRCECGKYIGAAFEGEVCPYCGKPVKYEDTNILYTGWLNFYPYRIINPLFYQRLQSALSKKVLEDIISNENIALANGNLRTHNDDIQTKKGALKYHNIGMHEFYTHFAEIMEYYKTKRKQKAELIDSLIRDADIVWTSKIPVYSTILRPMGLSSESYFFSSINSTINGILSVDVKFL